MRDNLQQLLLAQLPKGCVQLGKDVVGVQQSSDGCRLVFVGGATSQRAYDMVVGADGIGGAAVKVLACCVCVNRCSPRASALLSAALRRR
jgi:2-polyprenyl-6-methoxyphenol hydroxylase-like FAD-dependent oxidoreductase